MRHHPRYRLRNRIRFAFAVVMVIAFMTVGGLLAAWHFSDIDFTGFINDTPGEPSAFKGRINVLALGVDAREGEKMARADTIMLVSVDTEKNQMSILSIPRDTRVRVPGHGWEKINSTTLFGGPSLAMKTVSDLVGIRVDKYVMTNYEGFKDIVDALGGVTIDVKERMYHYDPQDGGIYTIDLKPGVQRLDGDKALQFVRYRGYALGDISRAEQQQKFLTALVDEVLQPSTVVKLPSLVSSISKAVQTNLSIGEMKKLALAAAKMNNASLVTQTLPGKFLNTEDGSYWEVDPSQARLAIARLFEGRHEDKVVLGETTTMTSMYKPVSDGQQSTGAVVPGQSGQEGDKKDPKNNKNTTTQGTQGGAVKTGGGSSGSGQPSGSTGRTTGSSGASKPPGTSGQPAGGVVPGVPETDQQSTNKESGVVVIIESATPKKTQN
ncbi:MAG: LCP family protein [Bacillota bacterium]